MAKHMQGVGLDGRRARRLSHWIARRQCQDQHNQQWCKLLDAGPRVMKAGALRYGAAAQSRDARHETPFEILRTSHLRPLHRARARDDPDGEELVQVKIK